ncbi:MAG: phosphatase PAP2 family protein [Marinobacterium sp.]|nr:phosphatase PAP2 family protein [Marinobacterium sp.]
MNALVLGLLREKLSSFDLFAFYWCQGYSRIQAVQFISRQISRCGDGPLYLGLALMLAWLEPQYGVAFLQVGLLAFLIELPLYLLLKNSIRRARPCHRYNDCTAAIEPSDRFSFPSGHAAAAFVVATLLGHYYPALTGFSYSLAVLIGVSRVMLGVHYPCDIAAGALLGISSAVLALNLATL